MSIWRWRHILKLVSHPLKCRGLLLAGGFIAMKRMVLWVGVDFLALLFGGETENWLSTSLVQKASACRRLHRRGEEILWTWSNVQAFAWGRIHAGWLTSFEVEKAPACRKLRYGKRWFFELELICWFCSSDWKRLFDSSFLWGRGLLLAGDFATREILFIEHEPTVYGSHQR